MKKGIYLLPNTITLCGMTCGFYAITSAVRGFSSATINPASPEAVMYFTHAAWAILIANIFDALDGWIARLTNSSSKFGVQLDSLSDLLTFCAASAVLVYSWRLYEMTKYGWGVSLFFVLCGALRLARYNIQADTAESRTFTGMPTPAAATILASGALFCLDPDRQFHSTYEAPALLILTLLLGFLMVSTIRYHSAKEIMMKQRKPFWWLVIVAGFLLLLRLYPTEVIFTCSILYMLSGLVEEGIRRLLHLNPHRKPPINPAPPLSHPRP